MAAYPVVDFENSRAAFDSIVHDLKSDQAGGLDHEELEQFITDRNRALMTLLAQDHLDLRTEREKASIRPMKGADGKERTEFRPSSCQLGLLFGQVVVHRIALVKHGVSGGLHPLDAHLNLPAGKHKHSLGVQREVAWNVAQTSFEAAVVNVRRNTATTIGKRQAEELSVLAAQDFRAYYNDQPRQVECASHLMVLTFDGKGVVMRPEGLRPVTRKRAEKAKAKALAEGSEPKRKRNRKRMAEVAAVYSLEVVGRTPDDVMRELSLSGPYKARPKAMNKRVWASLEDPITQVVDAAFDEAILRDEEGLRRWVALVDGNAEQLRAVLAMSSRYGVPVTIVLDFIHVLEYLWKAGRALHAKGDTKAVRAWVTLRARRILEGRSSHVAAGMRRAATMRKLRGKRRKKVDKCADYLLKYKEYLRYDEYLRDGLPIATGVIEGACRSLVRDRMDITGARWGLAGAEAVLKLRSLRASGDFDDYWTFHKRQELERNHLQKYDESELLDLRQAS